MANKYAGTQTEKNLSIDYKGNRDIRFGRLISLFLSGCWKKMLLKSMLKTFNRAIIERKDVLFLCN